MKLVDLYAVQDTVVSGLGRVDILHGGWARFVWYVERMNSDGTVDNVIVESLVMPIDSILQNRAVTDAALNTRREETEPVSTAGLH